MRNHIKIVIFGVLIWAVPFATSFLFHTKEGQIAIDIFLYKSIMLVLGSLTAAILMVLYFKGIKKNYLREGIRIGMAWLAINMILDLSILLSLSGMPIETYLARIGMRYLTIPIMSVAIGLVAEK